MSWLRSELDQLYESKQKKPFVYLYNNESEYKGCIRYCDIDCCPIGFEGTRTHEDTIYVFFPRQAKYMTEEEHSEADKNSRLLVNFEYIHDSPTHECVYPIFKSEFKAVRLKAMKLLHKHTTQELNHKMKAAKVTNVLALAEHLLKIPKSDLRWTLGVNQHVYPIDTIFFCVKRLNQLVER